jgi:hypothetical protein
MTKSTRGMLVAFATSLGLFAGRKASASEGDYVLQGNSCIPIPVPYGGADYSSGVAYSSGGVENVSSTSWLYLTCPLTMEPPANNPNGPLIPFTTANIEVCGYNRSTSGTWCTLVATDATGQYQAGGAAVLSVVQSAYQCQDWTISPNTNANAFYIQCDIPPTNAEGQSSWITQINISSEPSAYDPSP